MSVTMRSYGNVLVEVSEEKAQHLAATFGWEILGEDAPTPQGPSQGRDPEPEEIEHPPVAPPKRGPGRPRKETTK
jgi:hypothetical protein